MDSSGLCRAITDFAYRTPSWVQSAFVIWTAYGLLLFGVPGGSVSALAALAVLALTGPARALLTAARTGGGPAVLRFAGPGPARRGR
ncbi:hypothetical protein [Streptomyces sp. DSM 40907]|uniref:hypothetical protein n=1 Tax=Streptomyces kutzneri TaxID=3051179 RepID=UPI0028D665AF|nr:hypothetical protein [Streptomyces sp. DSM 40907]